MWMAMVSAVVGGFVGEFVGSGVAGVWVVAVDRPRLGRKWRHGGGCVPSAAASSRLDDGGEDVVRDCEFVVSAAPRR